MIDDTPQRLTVAEAAARRLVLAEALETSEAGQRLIGAAERERIDQEALAATGDPARGQRAVPAAWLQDRADRLVTLAVQRQPGLDALAAPGLPGSRWLRLLPVLGLLAGLLLERIDNPKQVNLLSPPLLAFLAWNVAVYLAIALGGLLSLRPRPGRASEPFWRSFGWPGGPGRGLKAQVATAFGKRWWQLAGGLEAQRVAALLHVSAAAWALGVGLSVLLGGVVHEYRIGWESTLLDDRHVHAVLQALFAPVRWVFQLQPFSLDEVVRLHFSAPAPSGQADARRWVWMYLALLGLVVLLPRLVLAIWAGLRAGRLARRLQVDLASTHYEQLLGRISPARVRIGLHTVAPTAAPTLVLLWRQAAGEAAWTPGAHAADLLLTERGDRLQVQEVTASANPFDLLLVAADDAALDRALPSLTASARPVLVLATAQEGDLASRLRAAGLAHEVLPLAGLPTWREDARLRAAIARLVPAHRRAGVERLHVHWRQRANVRLREAMGWLASDLLEAAADSERLPAWSLRGMLGVMDASEDGRRQAQAVLADRLRSRQAATNARLLERHALEAAPDGLLEHAAPAGFRSTGGDVRQAGLAGAASGAALGATVDAATGLISLGAASALGGLVGGAAALGAVLWRRRQAGAPELVFDDGALEVVAQAALLRYLAVAHAGRAGPLPAQGHWAGLAKAAVERERGRLAAAWAQPKGESVGDVRHAALAHLLQDLALGLLAELHGAVPDA